MPPRTRSLAGIEGFTLVELLVAMATGLVILFGAFAIIDVATRTTAQVTGRVDAEQHSRSAMDSLVNEMVSGCLAPGVSPVQAVTPSRVTPAVRSDGTHAVFVSGLGDGSSATPTLHVVSLTGGSLVDTSYANTGGAPATTGAASTWTFSTTPSGKRALLGNVAQVGSTPIFQYFSFSNPSNAPGNSLSSPAALSTPLNATWPPVANETNGAPSVAEVTIEWKNGPSDGSSDPLRSNTLTNSAIFRLTPASPTSPNYPCE